MTKITPAFPVMPDQTRVWQNMPKFSDILRECPVSHFDRNICDVLEIDEDEECTDMQSSSFYNIRGFMSARPSLMIPMVGVYLHNDWDRPPADDYVINMTNSQPE